MQRNVANFQTMRSLSRQDFSQRSDIPLAKVPLLKRVLDIFCLLLALPTLLPLFAGIALLIKVVSPGPVFFTQERIGFMGRRFRVFKFRTMKVNAETQTHQNHLKELINSETPMTKMDSQGDPRVIKFSVPKVARSGSVVPKWVKNAGTAANWAKNLGNAFKSNGTIPTVRTIRALIEVARKYKLPIECHTGRYHPPPWNIPHLHIGKPARFHVPLPPGWTPPGIVCT